MIKNSTNDQAVVAQAFNPRIQEERQADFYEFKVNLAYRVSSGTTRAMQ